MDLITENKINIHIQLYENFMTVVQTCENTGDE